MARLNPLACLMCQGLAAAVFVLRLSREPVFLLQQTSYTTQKPYKVVFLTNTQNEPPKAEYKAGQQMRLNVTVCLIMYNEPSFENSFLNKTESEQDAIL